MTRCAVIVGASCHARQARTLYAVENAPNLPRVAFLWRLWCMCTHVAQIALYGDFEPHTATGKNER